MHKQKNHFLNPHQTATPAQRKRLMVLVVMAGVIIVLIWILSLPFNYGSKKENTDSGPSLTKELRQTISTGKKTFSTYFKGNKND